MASCRNMAARASALTGQKADALSAWSVPQCWRFSLNRPRRYQLASARAEPNSQFPAGKFLCSPPVPFRFFPYANGSSNRDGRSHAAIWRTRRGGPGESERQRRAILWLSGPQRRWKIDHHQNAHGPSSTDGRPDSHSESGFGAASGGGEAADRRGAGRSGALWTADSSRVFEFRGTNVRTGSRDGGPAHQGAPGIYAAGGPAENADHGLFARNAEEARNGRGGDSRAEDLISRRAIRGRGCNRRGNAEIHAAADDGARRNDFPDLSRARDS